jgi:spermidine/putrescine transport system substrate-binding protein
MTRREWIHKSAGSSLLCLTGCRGQSGPVSTEPPALRLLCWSRFFDPKLLAKFEEQHQCQLLVSYFETNEELFTRLDADPNAFDVITPSSYLTPQLIAEGKLMELDAGILNLPDTEMVVAGKAAGRVISGHAVSYSWSAAGIAYHTKHAAPPFVSWRVFEDPAIKGRFTLLEDMRELLGAGLKACGKSVNSTSEEDLKQAGQVVAQWIASSRKLDNEAYTYALIAGEDLAAQAYNGDVWIARRADADLRFVIPDEGTTLAVDQLCLASRVANVALAHAFIAFMCQPENAKQNMAWSGYLSTNPDVVAAIPELVKTLSDEFAGPLAKSEIIAHLGVEGRLWENIWQSLFQS